MPSVSVIIPNYNHAAFLEERIQSVLNQTYEDFEIILLDDASTDGSGALLKRFEHHPKVSHSIYNRQNSGSPFHQWVKGALLAKGDWLWLAEADDVASPQFLSTMMALQTLHPDAGLLYCNSTILSPAENYMTTGSLTNSFFNTEKWSGAYVASGRVEIENGLKTLNTICNVSAVLLRRDDILSIRDELKEFRFYGDWFAYLYILSSRSVVYTPGVLNTYRRPKTSLLQSTTDLNRTSMDAFLILRWLMRQSFITNKDDVARFFVKNYAGFGVRKHGVWQAIEKAAKYVKKDFRLTMLVFRFSMMNKLGHR